MSLSERCRYPADNQGSILILALWVIFMLAMLAVAVGAHIEGRLALARRIEQRTAGYSAARVGVERGISGLLQDTNSWDGLGEPWSDSRADFSNVVSGAGAFSLFHVMVRSDGGSNTVYGLWDEQSKIDLSHGKMELIIALLKVAGGLSDDEAVKVGAAISLARDRPAGKAPSLGDKSGWVNSRLEPGPFRSIYELEWVKGMTPEIFSKIRDFVTVSGGDKVNLNTAEPVVLESLGVIGGSGNAKAAQNLARKILQFRERGGTFKTCLGAGLAEALGEEARLTDDERRLLYSMARYGTVASDHFRGHSEGWMASGGDSQRRSVDFVWDRKKQKFEFWHED